MKNIGKLLLLTLILALSVFTAVSCGDDDVEISIAVKDDAMPQLQFVLGEELDFSAGVLVVTEDGSTTEIPLNSSDITVTGYDKTKLGEQTVTIEYMGESTQLTVTVVERMTVSDYVTDYLVGDTLNTAKGRLKITRNDGTTYTVPLSNSSVTIEGFSSAAAATGKTLTARYTASGEVYTATFNVNVYAVDSVKLHAPNKVAYNSHEGVSVPDVSGGYLTLTGNGGKLSKDVTLTADMVSGFDLGAVNKTNTPHTQTLTVTYDNKTYTYPVKLVYTDISLFNENAAGYTSLVWTGSTLPTITEAQGELALEMMELYLDMSKAERSYISTSDALNVARAAMAYGYVIWSEEIESYPDVFGINESTGRFEYYCKSYAAVNSAIDGITATDSPFYTIAPIINKISDEFAKETVITGLTFADCAVIDAATIKNKAAELNYMLDLHEKFALIPDSWATENIATYEAKIKDIYSFITASHYNDSSASQLYMFVSSWRTNDDAFDILYSYYFGKNDMDSITALAALRLPAELQELFDAVAGAFNQISQITAYNVFDTSGFFYYYYKALKLSAEVENTENAIIKELYETLPLNGLIGMADSTTEFRFETLLEYFRTANNGSFQYYSSSMLGMEKYHELLDEYVATLTKLLDEPGFEDTAEYGESIQALFNMYAALSPTEQLNFLSTLNAYYSFGYPPLAFNDTEDNLPFISMFNQLLNQYFREKLPTAAADAAYDNLVLAMEIYAQRSSYENWLAEFKSRMDSVISTYNGMSVADQAIFYGCLSAAYDKYVSIRARYNEPITSTNLGDWSVAFDALEEAIVNIDNAYYLLEQGYPVYNLLFSAYERAEAIVNNILTAPDEIKNAYYYEDLYVIPAGVTGGEDYYYSYEYMMNLYRGIYIDCMCGYFGGSANYFDAYTELNLGEFLNTSYELMWTFAWEYGFSTTLPTPPVFDKENTITAMEAFRNLNRDTQVLFTMIEGDYGLYYTAITKFIAEAFTASADANVVGAAEVGYKLIALEQLLLFTDPEDSTAAETLEAALTELEAMHSALAGEHATSFAALENVYADVVSDCQAMIDALTATDAE